MSLSEPRLLARALLLALASTIVVTARGCVSAPLASLGLAPFHRSNLRSDSLDLGFLSSDPDLQDRGWARRLPGASALVSCKRGSRLALPFRSKEPKRLSLTARTHPDVIGTLPLDLELNGEVLAHVVLAAREETFELALPSRIQVDGDNVLRLTVSPSSEEPHGRLALISALEVRPAAAESGPFGPVLADDRVELPPRSGVSHYLSVPEGARLLLDAQATTLPEDEDGPRFEAVVDVDESSGEEVARLGVSGRALTRIDADLSRWSGRIVRLTLQNQGTNGRLTVLRPRIVHLASVPVIASAGAPAATSASVAAPFPSARPPAAGERGTNLILYLVDTLRADALGAYGASPEASPRFDRFVRDAVLFTDASAQASWTLSTMASVFTGLHVAAHGLDQKGRGLRPDRATLAEILKARGFRTAAFVANPVMKCGLEHGFEAWNSEARLDEASADVVGDQALRWAASARRPFFLYVHTQDPHSPYEPAAADAALFDVEGYRGERDTRALLRAARSRTLPPEAAQFLEARYRGEVHGNDRAFGAFLDGLTSLGLLDDTVVVFTADHGEELFEHGGAEHSRTLYQELLRVPLAIRLPGGARGGARVPEPVQQIDLLPTLLGLLGVPSPAVCSDGDRPASSQEEAIRAPCRPLPGRDLAPGSAAGSVSPTLVFSEQRYEEVDKIAVRSGQMKLILNRDDPARWRAGARVELYDLAADPHERTNLATARPVTVGYLRQELARFRAEYDGSGPRDDPPPNAERREALQAMGYLR